MKRIHRNALCAVTLGLVACGVDPTREAALDEGVEDAALVAEGSTSADEEGATETGEERLADTGADVELSWPALQRPGSVVAARGTSLELELANTTSEALVMQLQLTGDDGGTVDRKLDLGEVQLAAGARHAFTVDVTRLRLSLASLAYSGRLHVSAMVRDARGARRRTVLSEPVYFHAATTSAAPTLTFYDETALRETFHRGDFRGTVPGLERDPEYAGILRVMDVGRGNASGDVVDPLAETQRPELLAANVTPRAGNATSSYETCMLFRTQTVDSGVPVGAGANKGGVEDYHADWDAGKDVTAYGARVVLSQGSWSQTYDADPVTGCFTWKTDRKGPFNVRVYAYSKNTRGAFVRVHNAVNDFSTTPGTAYSNYYTGFNPTPGGKTWIAAGGYGKEFTTAAVIAFGLRRFSNVGPQNLAFQVAIDNTPDGPPPDNQTGAFSSAHWGKSNDFITSGRHYLRVRNLGTSSQSRQKFVVAHEFGHAFAALYYGARAGAKNGGEPNVPLDFQTEPSNGCGMGEDTYTMFSQEWNAVGFREGFAHFLAALVWNNRSDEGSFHWMNRHLDLELYSNGAGNMFGGRLENVCSPFGNKEGAGTNEDWLLFFWDYFTGGTSSCAQEPALNDMLALYADTRLLGGLKKDNYYEKMREAAAARTSLPKCVREDRFEALADYNAIDH